MRQDYDDRDVLDIVRTMEDDITELKRMVEKILDRMEQDRTYDD